MRVAIFTEGSREMGFGHIARCSALCEAFLSFGLHAKWFVRGDDSVASMLQGYDVQMTDWTSSVDAQNDFELCVVDSYEASCEIYELLCKSHTVMALDDFARLEYPKDAMLLNAAPNSKRLYDGQSGCFGALYALLRPPFWGVFARVAKPKIQTLLITFGGSDKQGMTSAVLEKLSDYRAKKLVVAGAAYMPNAKMECEECEVLHAVDAAQMRSLMERSDAAISAGGQTLFELACTGVPTIVLQTNENQTANIAGLTTSGALLGCESIDELPNALSALEGPEERNRMIRAAQSTVDGRGAVRAARALLTYHILGLKRDLQVGGYRLKHFVALDDKALRGVLAMRNHPEVRRASFDNRPIDEKSHFAFADALGEDENRGYWLVHDEKSSVVGVVSFVQIDWERREAHIGLYKNPSISVHGVGAKMLDILEELANMLGIRTIVAEALSSNAQACALYENRGFVFAGYGEGDSQRYEKDINDVS